MNSSHSKNQSSASPFISQNNAEELRIGKTIADISDLINRECGHVLNLQHCFRILLLFRGQLIELIDKNVSGVGVASNTASHLIRILFTYRPFQKLV